MHHPTAWLVVLPFCFNALLLSVSTLLARWIEQHVESHFRNEEVDTEVPLPDYARVERLGALAGWAAEIGAVFGTVTVTLLGVVSLLHAGLEAEATLVFAVVAIALISFSVYLRQTDPTNAKANRARRFLPLGLALNIIGAGVVLLVTQL
jgi:nitrate/nitrite transporter NarK